MKALLAPAFTVLAIAAVVLAVRDAGPASATGVGPNIELGTPVGLSVPVLATTSAVDAYNAVNIHVRAVPSGGVTVTALDFDATGTVLGAPGDFFCSKNSPATNERVVGCATFGTQIVAPGLLQTLNIAATGNGCVYAGLVRVPGSAALDTFTVNSADNTVQTNTVNTSVVHVLIGSGTEGDCLIPTVTPTVTATPTITNTPTPHPGPPLGPDIELGTPGAAGGGSVSVPVNASSTSIDPF